MNTADRIYEAAKPLPETMAREVLDFIGYLRSKQARHEWQHAQRSSLDALWDNDDDEAWNHAAGR